MATTKNLGVVSMVPAGDWSSDTNYQKANFVRNNKATYMAKAANRNIEPGVSPNWQQYWMLCNYDGVAAAPTAIPLPDAETGAIGDDDSYAAANHVHPMSSVYESAQDALNKAVKSPILTGSAISADNTLANAVTPFKVESKNLIPYPYYNGQSATANGVTFTVNEDRSITASGTATGYSGFIIVNNFPIPDDVDVLTIGLQGESTNISINVGLYDSEGEFIDNVSNYVNTVNTFRKSDFPTAKTLSFSVKRQNNAVVSGTFFPIISVGDTLQPYTPYVADGTAAQVVACGKNLFNCQASPSSQYQVQIQNTTPSSIVMEATQQTTYGSCGWKLPKNIIGKTVTLSASWTGTGAANGAAVLRWGEEGSITDIAGSISNSGTSITTLLTPPNENAEIYLVLYIGYSETVVAVGDSITFTNVQVEIGDNKTEYEQYNATEYSTQVGQTVEITQRDKYTTIYAETDGVAVSGQFTLSTQYELNDKLTPLFGTFANRPTTTQPYTIMYIATDQTGDNKVTILPANADGSVSGNWITI